MYAFPVNSNTAILLQTSYKPVWWLTKIYLSFFGPKWIQKRLNYPFQMFLNINQSKQKFHYYWYCTQRAWEKTSWSWHFLSDKFLLTNCNCKSNLNKKYKYARNLNEDNAFMQYCFLYLTYITWVTLATILIGSILGIVMLLFRLLFFSLPPQKKYLKVTYIALFLQPTTTTGSQVS